MEQLLKWSIENSTSQEDGQRQPAPTSQTQLNHAALTQLLFGSKDEGTMMKEAMEAIVDNETSLEDKKTAFDNLEMLCESLDNANNLEILNLWEPLLAQLGSPEPDLRFMAAWVCGTAIQNNIKTQKMFHELGGIEKIIDVFLNDPEEKVRTKSVYTLSSAIRNYEPAFRTAIRLLPDHITEDDDHHHENMERIDRMTKNMREEAKRPR